MNKQYNFVIRRGLRSPDKKAAKSGLIPTGFDRITLMKIRDYVLWTTEDSSLAELLKTVEDVEREVLIVEGSPVKAYEAFGGSSYSFTIPDVRSFAENGK